MNKKNIGLLTVGILMLGCLLPLPAAAMEAGGVDIHGFVSQGFIISEEYNYLTKNSKKGSFEYNEMGINFGKELTDKLRLGVQFFSRDIGDAANNKVTVDWAYGDYRFQDWLGLRAGRIKLPYGLYNESRDMDMLRTPIVLPQGFYPDLIRDTYIAINGAAAYGNVDLNMFGSLDYQVLAGGMSIDLDNGFEKFYNKNGRASFSEDPDTETAYAGSLRWNTPLDGLLLGASALFVEIETEFTDSGISMLMKNDAEYFTLSSEYTFGDLALAAEYAYIDGTSTIIPAGFPTTVRGRKTTGYYVSASYRFTDLFSVGAYYSVYYPDKDDKDGNLISLVPGSQKSDAWEKDLAVTLRFDVNDNMVVKVEGHHVDGTANVIPRDNLVRTEDEFSYGVVKVSLSF